MITSARTSDHDGAVAFRAPGACGDTGSPEPHFSYSRQPTDNVDCWRLGEACRAAANDPKCGDFIDRGLILLRELEQRGFGVVKL